MSTVLGDLMPAFYRHLNSILALSLLSLYFVTIPSSLTETDSAEWAVAALYGGVPHPSGYPLYAILCRIFVYFAHNLLPVISILSLLSALCATLAALLHLNILIRLGYSRFLSFISTLVIFTSYPIWFMSNLAEPFTLNLLICSAILSVGVDVYIKNQSSSLGSNFLMGLLFGLAACNHHSAVFLLGFCILLFRHLNKWKDYLVRAFVFTVAFIIGIAPYLYLFLASSDLSPLNSFKVTSFSDLIHLFFRVQYGTFTLAEGHHSPRWIVPGYFSIHLLPWLTYVFFIGVLIGIFLLLIKRKHRFLKTLWFVSFALSSFVFLSLFRMSALGIFPAIIERFMSLPMIFLIYPLAEFLTKIFSINLKSYFLKTMVFVFLLGHIFFQYTHADRSHADFYENHSVSNIKIAKKYGSDLVIAATHQEDLGNLYAQWVLGTGGQNFKYIYLVKWSEEDYRLRTIGIWRLPNEFINESFSKLIYEILSRIKRAYVVDIPRDPKPSLFMHGFELGPGFVLMDAKEKLPNLEEIIRLNEEVYRDLIKIPTCKERQKLKAWDRELLMKYSEALYSLEARCEKAKRLDLVERVRKILSVFTSCDLEDLGTLSSWIKGRQ